MVKVRVESTNIETTPESIIGFINSMNNLGLIDKISIEKGSVKISLYGGVEYTITPDEDIDEYTLLTTILAKFEKDKK